MFDYVVGFIWGVCFTVIIITRFFVLSKKHPYRWRCPECGFFVSTNKDPDFVVAMADGHEQSHKEGRI